MSVSGPTAPQPFPQDPEHPMDSLLIDATLRRLETFAGTLRRIQAERHLHGDHPDASDLEFARMVARAAVDEGGNLPALLSISLRLRATAEAMSHHHPRIDWVEAHDRVRWGYVSVLIRTYAIALAEAIESGESHGGSADRLRVSDALLERVAGSITAEGVARLEYAVERTRDVLPLVDPDAVLDERVDRFATTPWPEVVGAAACSR